VQWYNPNSLPIEDNGRTMVWTDAPVPNLSSMRISLKFAGLVDVPVVGESAVCRVGAHYDLGLAAVDTEGRWSFNSALLTVGMLFRL
jgi:hypothetical protein